VGVAGLGRSGWNIHVAAMRPMADRFKIVAVADPNAERCSQASAEFGCRTYASPRELFKDKDVELAVVATPNHLHAPHSIEAMKAGKHVVCEKPIAATAAQADEMIATSKKTGRVLAPFQNRRYMPDFLKVREVIESGKLGRIVLIKMYVHSFARRWDWQTLREFSGGSLNNTGAHFVDQALQLFGPAEPEVFCHLERVLTLGDADDHVKLILRAPNSPMIDLEIVACCPYPQDNWLVMGTTGGLRGSFSELHWKYTDFSKMPVRQVDRQPTPDRSYNSEKLEWTEESWTLPKTEGPQLSPFYLDLYETLTAGKPLYITPESVRRQIALLEKCHAMCGL